MPATLASLGIDKLPYEEQRQLQHELTEHLNTHENKPFQMTPEQYADLKERLAELDANPDDVVPWETVKANLDARWRWHRVDHW